VDFDRNRLSTGELIAGISGVVLLIDLWFKWYGVKVSGAGGALKNFSIGVSATAWQAFGFIDILLFLIALIAIGVAVLRAMDRMPEMPYPAATLVAGAGALALLLIIFRIIDTPVDTGGVSGIDVTRKIGVWIGLLAAAGITYGGWRAMQEGPATVSRPGGAGAPVQPTSPMPAAPAGGAAAPAAPAAPAGGAAAPPAPAAPAADPAPGTAPETPPGLAGEPPAGEGTRPPGV
jgi:hypothetical protein